VDQGRRLQRLPRILRGNSGGSEPAEVVVDQWQQSGGGVGVAAVDLLEDLRDFVHVSIPFGPGRL
jgi:hypothetical protein